MGRSTRGRARLTRVARWAREGLLTLAALGGLACITALVASTWFGVSFVVFRSGSMAPAIPQGSVAIVREIPATSVRVGDVVTVESARSTRPVTHRVVAIDRSAHDPDTVVLTMKGDANSGVDPFTYPVQRVKRVVASLAGAGGVVRALETPWALGIVTLLTSAIVVWVFWPERNARGERRFDPLAALVPRWPRPEPRSRRRAAWPGREWRAATVALTVVALGVSSAGTAHAQSAVDGLTIVPENGSPGLLFLTSSPYPADFPHLTPGDTVWWQIGAHLRDETRGALSMRIESSGELVTMPGGLMVRAASCSRPWNLPDGGAPPTCLGEPIEVLASTRLADVTTASIPLGELTDDGGAWLQFSLSLPADASDQLQGRTGRIAVALTAAGDHATNAPVPEEPTEDLAFTGADVRPVVIAALASLAVGLTLVAGARRRQHTISTAR